LSSSQLSVRNDSSKDNSLNGSFRLRKVPQELHFPSIELTAKFSFPKTRLDRLEFLRTWGESHELNAQCNNIAHRDLRTAVKKIWPERAIRTVEGLGVSPGFLMSLNAETVF
jgi:hypothetical protein